MIFKPAMTEMLKPNDNVYAFVVSVAKRARKIAETAEAQGIGLDEKPVQLSVVEFSQHPWDISAEIAER